MLAQLHTARPAVPGTVLSAKRQRSLRCFAAAGTASSGSGKEIYIGHEKEDYENKRVGNKGRFIVDDPSKYPGREADALSGGWAGGEAGLKAFVADYEREKKANGGKAPAAAPAKPADAPKPLGKGKLTNEIYIGHEKEDYANKRVGNKGRFVVDDPLKYPTRTELTGGFAGGERGLQAFKETGDVPIAPEGQGKKQTSPLIIAGVLGLAATGGGLLLSTVEEVGESVLTTSGPQLGLDDTTKAALTAGILLVGVIGTVAGTQVLLDTMANKVKAGASKLAILGLFWGALFLAAKFVLEG